MLGLLNLEGIPTTLHTLEHKVNKFNNEKKKKNTICHEIK